ncbi:hypothetical protein K503DRAFT_803174 [Rhizopogon vinicolor AM-OR11-026]|uniref:Uncharacterized protein n=1 Tax=Rhizopogon vinicolor AM-OR11-026 TaxID=1314800 RepID=A0A1B7MQW9_9AGAM|nr:hypothetical protein K503DRAFT_803174 [Rhizopogon vinicolor AM-OR11-026]
MNDIRDALDGTVALQLTLSSASESAAVHAPTPVPSANTECPAPPSTHLALSELGTELH